MKETIRVGALRLVTPPPGEYNPPMTASWTPMRWPGAWRDPGTLDLLKGTAINYLLIEQGADLGPVAARAEREGLKVSDPASLPKDVTVIEGEWPGVKLSESGAVDRASAGPTGIPWIDSNGWKIRLAAELRPGRDVWVAAAPLGPRLFHHSYVVGVADAAAHGGRWIISLDSRLAAGMAEQSREALQTWKGITDAAGFFAARQAWSRYRPEAVIGIISDFSGRNEFLSGEILNLVARTNQQYRIIVKGRAAESSFSSLKAVLYHDEDPPSPELRKLVLAFVRAGAMLITGPGWGQLPGVPDRGGGHPRYALRVFGKGRVAAGKPGFEDPYLMANDSVVLVSRRHELLRFWNGGAVGAHLTMDPDRKRAVAHMLFYAFQLGDNRPTVRVAGRYRKASLWTLDQRPPRDLDMEIENDAVELHLPPVEQYAAVELEV